MKNHYHFAGLDICIDIPDDRMYQDERWLGNYKATGSENAHTFSFELVDELSPPKGACVHHDPGMVVYKDGDNQTRYIGSVQQSWANGYLRAEHCGKNHRIQLLRSQYLNRVGVHTVMNGLAAEHLIARNGGYVFHCSYIELNGRAVLFTAPSGTGKSTQADLWNYYRGTKIINGDRAAIRIADDRVVVDGIPFAGSSQYCENRSLPLEAIVYLAQAPQTSVKRLRGYAAFKHVWEGVSVNTWDPEDMALVSEAVKKTVEQIPVFYLACSPDESAVCALEQALSEYGGRNG